MIRHSQWIPIVAIVVAASVLSFAPWSTFADAPPETLQSDPATHDLVFVKLGEKLKKAALENPFENQRAVIVLERPVNLTTQSTLTAFRLSKSSKTAPNDIKARQAARVMRRQAMQQTQKLLIPELETLGIRTVHSLPYLDALAIEGSAFALVQAANFSEIKGIYLPYHLSPAWAESSEAIDWPRFQGVETDPEQPLQHSGAGMVVAVLDTGLDFTKAPFNCEESNEFGKPTGNCAVLDVNETAATDGQLDNLLHGTSTAGIVHNMAPEAEIIAYDIFETDSVRDFSPEIALNDVLRRKVEEDLNVSIVLLAASNESGFHPGYCENQTLPSLIDQTLFDEGITVVTPSGNQADISQVSYPACSRRSVAVGATYDFKGPSFGFFSSYTDNNFDVGDIGGFSNACNMIDLWAPGAIVTTDPEVMRAGTSQAAAFVAGALAAYLGDDSGPWSDATSLLSFLRMSGRPTNDTRSSVVTRRQSNLWLQDWNDTQWTEFEHFDSPNGLVIPTDEALIVELDVLSNDETKKIQNLRFELELLHTDPENLSITLQSPTGTSISLDPLAGEGYHLKATYGHHVAADLSVFNGELWASGTWTLTIDATAAAAPSEGESNLFLSSGFLVQTLNDADTRSHPVRKLVLRNGRRSLELPHGLHQRRKLLRRWNLRSHGKLLLV